MSIPSNHPAIVQARAKGLLVGERAQREQKLVPFSWSITLEFPAQVRSEANLREHWTEKKKRSDQQRMQLRLAWVSAGLSLNSKPDIPLGVRVTWTKLGGKKLDSDNLAGGAFKALRDRLSEWLGLDDGDERIEWLYEQLPGGPVGVRVKVEVKAEGVNL